MNAEARAVDRYGVMGYPVAHSRSPLIHRLFAEQTGQNLRYERLKVPPGELEQAIGQFQRRAGRGLNVTAPHKAAACRIADRLSERASAAESVNTLVFADGDILGDNTDGIGLSRDLAVNRGLGLEGSSILLLGAGGAARGIVGPLLDTAPERMVIVNRTVNRAERIARRFARRGPVRACGFDTIPTGRWDLIVNATSAGLKGETPPYPDTALSEDTLCYDLCYGLEPTPFCRWARERGAARVVAGWGMLVEQAAESFYIWRGIRPDTAPVLERIAAGLDAATARRMTL